jgi:AraC-like DNA-binding protein
MNKITLKTFSTSEITKKISEILSVELESVCSANELKIPTKHGTGKVTTIDFDNGLHLALFDFKLKDSFTLNFLKGNAYPLNFMFCSKGAIIHKLCDDAIHYQLETMRSSITSCPCEATQSLTFPGEQHVTAAMISVDRKVYTELSKCHGDELPKAFTDAINDQESEQAFFYQGNADYQLTKAVKALFNLDLTGLEDFVFAESALFEGLGHFIRNYKENQNPERFRIALNKYDLDSLTHAKTILVGNLNNAPTIPELAKLVGINQQKLKKGFKNVFGKTINQFLIQKRMEAAKILLTQDGSSIRDVATQVGYSNQSHFSSKFREHFGMLPKDFIKSVDVSQLRAEMN